MINTQKNIHSVKCDLEVTVELILKVISINKINYPVSRGQFANSKALFSVYM